MEDEKHPAVEDSIEEELEALGRPHLGPLYIMDNEDGRELLRVVRQAADNYQPYKVADLRAKVAALKSLAQKQRDVVIAEQNKRQEGYGYVWAATQSILKGFDALSTEGET